MAVENMSGRLNGIPRPMFVEAPNTGAGTGQTGETPTGRTVDMRAVRNITGMSEQVTREVVAGWNMRGPHSTSPGTRWVEVDQVLFEVYNSQG